MDLDEVTVRTDSPLPGMPVAMTFADGHGGDPVEVVGRVMTDHLDLLGMMPRGPATVCWRSDPGSTWTVVLD